jgi:hypothetical protein
MEVGELLDEAFDLYKKNFRLFFGIAMLLAVPLGVLLLATPQNSEARLAVNVITYVVTPITTCALTYAALERYLGRQTTIARAYRLGLTRFLRLLSGYLVFGLAALIGFLALVLPTFVVALWGMLLLPIVVVENRGGVAAFNRARELSRGQVWRLFVLALGLALVVLIFLLVLATLAGLAASFLGVDQPDQIDRSSSMMLLVQAGVIVLSLLFQAAWSPVFAAAQLLLYLDLRIRREAYDLDLLADAAEARVATARSLASTSSPLPGQVGP